MTWLPGITAIMAQVQKKPTASKTDGNGWLIICQSQGSHDSLTAMKFQLQPFHGDTEKYFQSQIQPCNVLFLHVEGTPKCV